MADVFSRAMDTVFDSEIGLDATFSHQGGDPADVRVLVSAPDETYQSFGQERVSETTQIEIRVSEAALVSVGDEFVVGGVTYKVGGQPRRDPRRLKWICEAPEV